MTQNHKKRSILVDDKKYWRDRHSNMPDLKASGIKSVGVKSNHYLYEILADQYLKLLKSLDLKNVKSVLDCGFGDGYFLLFFHKNFPKLNLYGVDISPAAKEKIDFMPHNHLYLSEIAKFDPGRKFDLVHCFDVLYHILQTDDYVKTLERMAKLSNDYIILHERFLSRSPRFSSKHVYMRRAEFTNQILNAQGFYLYEKMPTHFFAMRMWTYKLNKFMPAVFYKLDNYIANSLHPSTQDSLSTHEIRVYRKTNR